MWPLKDNKKYRHVQLREDNTIQNATMAGDMKQDDTSNGWPAPLRQTWRKRIAEILPLAICVLCLWITVAVTWRTTSSSRLQMYESRTLTCGNTTAEAKARGCVFDLLANKFVPSQCLDPYTESEYRTWLFSPERAYGPFPFFIDQEGKHHIPDEHSLSLHADGQTEYSRRVYTTREQHLAHCAFVFRRLHRAMEGKASLSDEYLKMSHTEHCTTQLLLDNSENMGRLVEECYIGYSTCTVDVPI